MTSVTGLRRTNGAAAPTNGGYQLLHDSIIPQDANRRADLVPRGVEVQRYCVEASGASGVSRM